MTQEGFKRKLTAILSADAVGYSRLMREDEEATVRNIATHFALITEIIQQHHGRVIDSPGDNILAEFASVVEAVNGAIKIQEEIKKSNADTPKDRRMEFRIGINLGDVIEEEDRIYGDGVNIAARVEGLASAGGISISGTVYEHIKEKLSLGYHYLGEQNVKNISEPVRVYRLLTEPNEAGKMIGEENSKSGKFRYAAFGAFAVAILAAGALVIWNYYIRIQIEPASLDKMAYPLPDKPSIAVLPFVNLSDDQEQGYLTGGLTDNIITALSKIPELFVIARNSISRYKGKVVEVHRVSEDLGIRYVLQGSVQRSGKRLRVTAQLIDALKGQYIWSEKYDHIIEDLLTIQDDISFDIAVAMNVNLREGEQARVWASGTDNVEAYLKYLRAYEYFNRFKKDNMILTRQLCDETIALDPDYAAPYVLIGVSHMIDFWFSWGESRSKSMEKATAWLQKAIDLNTFYDMAHACLGHLYALKRQYDKAVGEGEKAVELNPNGDLNLILLAMTYNYIRRYDEAIFLFKKAIRLNPSSPSWYIHNLGHAYRNLGKYEEAIAEYKKALSVDPNSMVALGSIAQCYALAGREEDAHAAAAEYLKVHPKYIASESLYTAYKYKEDREMLVNAERLAGIAE